MDVILHQLGGLVLGSVPTMIFFLLLVTAYSALVRRPLDRVLAERHARTAGAVEQARGAMAAAEAETAVYEDKLRSARAGIVQARDQRLKQWAAEREAALEEVQAAMRQRLSAAKDDIELSAIAARQHIESTSMELSAQILRAVLPAGVSTEAVQ